MTEQKNSENRKKGKIGKYLNGPGTGLIIMGISYIIWWFAGPWAWQAFFSDPRWAHNWAYAIIIFNVGLSWYHKTPLSRILGMIQASMLPVTASGSFNTVICTIITAILLIIWIIIFLSERKKEKKYFEGKLSRRGWNWTVMHSVIISWILIAHMGLMFFIARLPLEAQLMTYSNQAGYLANLPPESLEFATWTFDIGLFIWAGIVIWEQYKLGYNVKNKPWPKWSFYVAIAVMVISLLALLIQDLTIGFDWVQKVYP